MLITRIELENIKSYCHITVDFRRGTTAISGPNGAGKTTIVEAIGFALFDYLSYNQSQFVREGEKYGRVVIHLIGSDDRPYEVERRCGAGAKWVVYDREADLRVEQRTDVLDKLHELFGIDRERPLDVLFRDALGVPQGTFTAIFLEAPSKRKQTFDALLQIEDFKTAFDYLLNVEKVYQEQIQTQKTAIQRLEIETHDLEGWRAGLKHAGLDDQQTKDQNLIELFPLVEQQHELEKQSEALARQVTQREGLLKEAQRFQQQRTNGLQQLESLQQRIAAIEPLQPLAEQLTGRVEKLARLQAMIKERGSKRLQFEEKHKQLQAKRDERETVADSLRKIEDTIAKIEAHRQEAEELPALQKQHEQLSAQQHRLEGNIEGYMKSRRQSAGGQCPLLNQPCLNIIQLGMVSLESYFDGLLAGEHAH